MLAYPTESKGGAEECSHRISDQRFINAGLVGTAALGAVREPLHAVFLHGDSPNEMAAIELARARGRWRV